MLKLKKFNEITAQDESVPEKRIDVPICVGQWPVQIKLMPAAASYFNKADLLVAADCVAYTYYNFCSEYVQDKVIIIGCPKLDECDYAEKLTAILQANDIKSVTVARMDVPCCAGIEDAVKTALKNCGKSIPWQIITIFTNWG